MASLPVSGNVCLLGTIEPMGLSPDAAWGIDCCLLNLDSGELSSISELAFEGQA